MLPFTSSRGVWGLLLVVPSGRSLQVLSGMLQLGVCGGYFLSQGEKKQAVLNFLITIQL